MYMQRLVYSISHNKVFTINGVHVYTPNSDQWLFFKELSLWIAFVYKSKGIKGTFIMSKRMELLDFIKCKEYNFGGLREAIIFRYIYMYKTCIILCINTFVYLKVWSRGNSSYSLPQPMFENCLLPRASIRLVSKNVAPPTDLRLCGYVECRTKFKTTK